MSERIQLLFDECVGRPLVEGLATLLKLDKSVSEVKRLLEMQQSGTADRLWIPTHAKEGWVLVTADRHRKGSSNAGGNLLSICLAHDMTCICLGKSVHQLRHIAKAGVILTLWQDIKAAALGDRGLQYTLQKSGASLSLIQRQNRNKSRSKLRIARQG